MVKAPPVHNCPDCGTALQVDAALGTGLCPSCLLELALDVTSVETELFDPEEAPTLVASSESFAEGEIQGERYRIRSLLGRGGMGEVWRAYDLKLRQDVALKSLLTEQIADAGALEMLRQEVRVAREVISPNVCRVFDLQEVDGQELVSMEYIDGTTLAEILEERSPLELDEAREIASQFLAGLEAVHDAGLVHRDIKPENIMLTRTGRVVVMDFGIAKALQEGQGSLAGTPAYMSPEQARAGELDARSDVFSAGVVLAEMVAPGGVRSRESRRRLLEGLHREVPRVSDSPWAGVIRRAVAAEPDDRFGGAAPLARALEEVTLRAVGDEEADPYPGLEAFTREQAKFFFGRELEVEALWKKLRRPHLLAVIGPSGAGKSSFLRAGLVPALSEGWRAIVTTPGDRPFANLARSLEPELSGAEGTAELFGRFEESEVAVELLSEWREAHDHVLVIVDQFEELFTQNQPEAQESFAELLGRLPLEADVHVLLSMRDDFLLQCQALEPLSPVFSEMTPLGPPTGASLRRAIVQPALKCGYRFESESLVESMLAEVEGERGALPMLAFAARQLWQQRDREAGLLTGEAYERIGGVGGALAQHAEETLEEIGQDRIPIVRELFRNLVTAQGTRAVRDRDDLLSVFEVAEGQDPHSQGHDSESHRDSGPAPMRDRVPAAEILDALVDARLLTSYEVDDEAAPTRIEIVHESLLNAWPRLVRWRAQDAEGAQLRDELRNQAQLWEQHGRSEDYLWTGAAYLDYLAWRERYPGGLTAMEEAFARAMRVRAERRQRRRRVATAAVIVLLLLVAGAISALWWQSESARRQAVVEGRRAEAANLFALAQLSLEDHPSAAVAYLMRSLELVDSPESRRLALRALWRGPTEQRLPSAAFLSLDFSPDGRWLVAGTQIQGGRCRVWPSDGGSPLVLEDCESPNEGLFDPTGERIAFTTGIARRELGVWSFPDGRLLRRMALGGLSTYIFGFSPDGRRIVTSIEKMASGRPAIDIRSWPVTEGEPEDVARLEVTQGSIGTFHGLDPTGTRLAWIEDHRLNVARMDGTVVDWQTATALEHDDFLKMAAFDAQGTRVATLDVQETPRVWSLATEPPELIRTFPVGKFGIVSSPSLRFDATGTKLGQAAGYVWDLSGPPDAEPIRLRVPGVEFGFGLAFEPRGGWVATGRQSSVSLWPLARPYPYVFKGHEGYPVDVQFSPDGRWLFSTSADGVRAWSLAGASGERSRVLYHSEGGYARPRRLAMAPDGSFVAVGTYIGKVLILPMDGGPTRVLEGFTDTVPALAVSPGARLVAAGAGDLVPEEAIVRVWDLETGDVRILDAGDGVAVNHLAFTENGRLVSVSGGILRVWDLEAETPGIVEEIAVPGAVKKGLHPHLRQLLYARSAIGRLSIYDLDKQTSRDVPSHGEGVHSAILDPTGRVLISADREGPIRVGTADGAEPHLLFGHAGMANGLAISPDGRWIASAADDAEIRVWPMPDLSEPPFHTLPLEDLLARLRSLTNLRAVEAPDSPAGWTIEIGPFQGWEEVPTW